MSQGVSQAATHHHHQGEIGFAKIEKPKIYEHS
jgi:hypothetical protein